MRNHALTRRMSGFMHEFEADSEPRPVDRAGCRPIRLRLREVSRGQLSSCPALFGYAKSAPDRRVAVAAGRVAADAPPCSEFRAERRSAAAAARMGRCRS